MPSISIRKDDVFTRAWKAFCDDNGYKQAVLVRAALETVYGERLKPYMENAAKIVDDGKQNDTEVNVHGS